MKKIILLVFLLFVLSACGTTGNGVADSEIVGNGEYVSIPLSDLSSTVSYYELSDGNIDIKYFIVLGSDGKPRTAFDACDVCGGYKGYQQQGTDIKCRNCGRVFDIDGLGTKNKGYGCWPSFLPHEINGNEVLIKVSDIKAGRSRFA